MRISPVLVELLVAMDRALALFEVWEFTTMLSILVSQSTTGTSGPMVGGREGTEEQTVPELRLDLVNATLPA